MNRLLLFCLCLGLWCLPEPGVAQSGSTASAASDLSGYRTAADAITTTLVRTVRVPTGQTGYLGIEVVTDRQGRLLVDEVEAGSPAAKAVDPNRATR